MKELKQELYNLCKAHLAEQVKTIEAAIADRREAMHNETKSSMGDKYETTREMLQQDISMNQNRLGKVKADEAVINSIDPELVSEIIMPGSVVYTNNNNFYIAVSAGHFVVEDKKYYAVSIASPIGSQLKGKRTGDSFTLKGKDYTVTAVL